MKTIEINHQQKYYRIWEIFPGFCTWFIFVMAIVLSIYASKLFASLIIIYAVYWLLKALIMSIRLIVGYKQYKENISMDWLKKCKNNVKNWEDVYHVVITATYKESFETLKYSLESICKANYPSKKIIFVLATEGRAKEIGRNNAKKLMNIFGSRFFHFAHIEHPANLPNEVVGKGANITYAAKEILKFIDAKKIPHDNVVVTTLDADHRPDRQYFAVLTYKYLLSNNRTHKSYQPLPMFLNNIWDVPIVIRSISLGSSFWHMTEATRPRWLRNFAAHAQPLSGLIETNFWSKLTIVEDGHQYWRSFFTFDGKYSVVPLHIPIYQDAVLSPKGYFSTFSEQYLQFKRWAWGASDIAYVVTSSIKNKQIPFYSKFTKIIRLTEGCLSWSTTSIILFFAGWLPFFVNPNFVHSVTAFNFPLIYSRILAIAMIGMIITLIISTLLLPARPHKSKNISVIIEWIITPFILPFSNIIFSAIPAIHAQTLLAMGKYMDYRVTEKKAVKYETSD